MLSVPAALWFFSHCFFHIHKGWWGFSNCGRSLFRRVPGLDRFDWRASQELFEVLSSSIECLGCGCNRVSLFVEDCARQTFRFVFRAANEVVHFTCLSRFICFTYFLRLVLQKGSFVLIWSPFYFSAEVFHILSTFRPPFKSNSSSLW